MSEAKVKTVDGVMSVFRYKYSLFVKRGWIFTDGFTQGFRFFCLAAPVFQRRSPPNIVFGAVIKEQLKDSVEGFQNR